MLNTSEAFPPHAQIQFHAILVVHHKEKEWFLSYNHIIKTEEPPRALITRIRKENDYLHSSFL